MTKVLYLDCFSGASGDMLLGALLDAGLPLDALRGALGSLGLRDYELRTERVLRAGVSATRFVLDERPGRHTHDHAHDHHHHEHGHAHSHHSHHGHSGHSHSEHRHHEHQHPEHPGHWHPEHHGHSHPEHPEHHEHRHNHAHHHHHSLREIEALISTSALSAASRERAIELFRRLAEVEAGIHQMPVERIHLHEVGALDSIIDIVGAVFAFEWFGADRIAASPLNLGSGMVRCAHGTFPVPAPATAKLLEGVPVYQDGPAVELTTPTGALLVTGFAREFGPMPPMRTERIGYGAGGHDFRDRPNVLRVFVGETEAAPATERVLEMSFELDDMNPQLYGVLMEALLAAGAHDVYYTPVQMKKNRPGTLVTIVAPPARREALADIVFRETTTLGVRYHESARDCLVRESVTVTTPWGSLPVKIARRNGAVVNAAPEFDACVRLARTHGVAVKDVQAAAVKAWLDLSRP